MIEKNFPKFLLSSLPEYKRFIDANPNKTKPSALNIAMAYGRAIHWLSIFDIIWPDFDAFENQKIEVGYIVVNDPDDIDTPPEFHRYLANMITMFWKVQLEQNHPTWKWEIFIDDDEEFTIGYTILSKS